MFKYFNCFFLIWGFNLVLKYIWGDIGPQSYNFCKDRTAGSSLRIVVVNLQKYKYVSNIYCFFIFSKKNLKQNLIEENEREEKEIRKLEKLLHIKKDVKKIKKSFYDEGMGDLLEFCDEEKRQEMINKEGTIHFS